MERLIKKNNFGDIACNDICIYSINTYNVNKNICEDIYNVWNIINPKYYIYNEDNMLLEIWYNRVGIVLIKGLGRLEKNTISNNWGIKDKSYTEITYKEAMSILEKEQNKDLGYNNKDLMSREITNGATGGLDIESLFGKNNLIDDRRFPFWVKVISGHDRPIGTIFYVKDESIQYIKEDVELYTGYVPSFTEDDLIDKLRGTKEQSKEKDYILEDDKQNNNGGASDWYSLPKYANTLQDLIEHRNMNGSVKDIFKACYRLGIKTEDELRDLNKIAYYSLREIGRITGRKDYITIAKELMGLQANEKDENEI